jgi:hypothetical protein
LRKSYRHYLNGSPSPDDVNSLIIGSNFLTRGKQRKALVRGWCPPFDLADTGSLKSILPEFDQLGAAKELEKFGYCRLPVALPNDLLLDLQKTGNDGPVRPGHSAPDMSLRDKPDPEISHIWDVPFDKVLRADAARLILQDRQLINVAALYLKCLPVVIGARLYWSLHHEKEEFLTPENWHVDAGDGLSFVKVFITLSDVSSANGPTGFILGSNKSLPRKFYSGRRFHEKEIRRQFKQEQFIEATGPQGTIYFCDTRGLHRGTPVKEGTRLLFHFLYGSDFFGSGRPTAFNLPSPLSFGDGYSGKLARTFAAFQSKAPKDTSKIAGP